MRGPKRNETAIFFGEFAAGNGLLDRRTLLRAGVLAAGIAGVGTGIASAADSIGADAPDWMKKPGASFSSYGVPSHWQEKVQRILATAPSRAGTGPRARRFTCSKAP